MNSDTTQNRQKAKLIACLIVALLGVNGIRAEMFDNLTPELLATNMQFTEGPVWHPDGYLIFSDINGNVIYKWSETAGLDTFIYPAGNPNGTACSQKNEFYVCRHGNRDIAKITTAGVVSSISSAYKGKKYNSPNDVALSYMGSIYFTDPDFGANTSTREIAYEGLYCIPYNSTTPVLLDSTLVKPNGLTFCNDWRTLYVCESNSNKIYAYTLREEYKLQDPAKDKKVFMTVSGTGEVDGITSDVFGNLYIAFGDGGIKIYNQSAQAVGQITLPSGVKVRNLCFGGKYNDMLYITAGTSLYRVNIRFYGDFIAPGLLGVPTDKSIVFNALSDKTLEAYIAFGTSSESLTSQTANTEFTANVPMEITISGLSANTQYYYQLYYRIKGETTYQTAISGSFSTQRAAGSVFSFAVEADPHLDEASNYITFRNALQNAQNLSPDFLIDLGDNFLTEKFPICNQYYIEQRNLLYRNFWDKNCSSMPLYIAQGNHEGELGWLSQNLPGDVFTMTTATRKKYYPTPEPDAFYTGSSADDPFVGKRENYYAWNWGDALFVVIDPYAYTSTKPTDPWGFTLGKTQYDWFRKTLEESTAKYKFVFAHQLVGGDVLGRGGSEIADKFEHGGNNADGTYGFDTNRPGWGKPLHQIMVDNGVQIYFHGHDHFYAEQPKDGIVYQEVPQPSFPGYTAVNDAATYGYTTGTILPNSGHINVKILGDSAKVDYISAYHVEDASKGQVNGNIRRTYYVKAKQQVIVDTTTQPKTDTTTTIKTPTDTTKTNTSTDIKNCADAYQSANSLFVRFLSNTQTQISLYSLTGQCVKVLYQGRISLGTSVFQMPSDLAAGVYLLRVKGESKDMTIKVLK